MKKTYMTISKAEIRVMQILIAILILLNLIMSLGNMKLALKYEKIVGDNNNLRGLIEMQKSAIADLEENLRREDK